MPRSQSGTRDGVSGLVQKSHSAAAMTYVAFGKTLGIVEIVDRAPEMIGMAVGEHHLGDCLRIDAGRFEIVRQLAGGRLEFRSRAGIDQHELAAGIDEGDIGLLRAGRPAACRAR